MAHPRLATVETENYLTPMKPRLSLFGVCLVVGTSAFGADPKVEAPASSPAPAPASAAPGTVVFPAVAESAPPTAAVAASAVATQEQLEQLVAPLALYPDPLVALILPAATSPSDIVLASRHLKANPNSTVLDDQNWDDAVKLLARYPTLISWMDENLEWTKQLGEAFMQQPADVMTAIQRVRARAKASGALADSPQQTVTVVGEDIRIVPAQPEVIYVPVYDPALLFVRGASYRSGSYLSFGIGFPVGYWLAYDCDWRYRTVRYVHRPERPRYWHSYHRPAVSVSVSWCAPDRFEGSHWRAWQPVYRPREHSPRGSSVAVVRDSSGGPERRDSTARYDGSRRESASRYDALPSSRAFRSSEESRSTSLDVSSRSSLPPNPAAREPSSRASGREGFRAPVSSASSSVSAAPAPARVAPSASSGSSRGFQPPQADRSASRSNRDYSAPPPSQAQSRSSAPPVSVSGPRSEESRRESSSPARSYSPPPASRSAEPSRSGRIVGESQGTARQPD